MGIKDLGKFIRDENIDCHFKIPLYHFSKYRIAIDSLNWVFSYLSMVQKKLLENKKDILEDIDQEDVFENLLLEWIKFNNKLMNFKITPVWIWDGKSKDNKTVTKIERKKSREDMINKKTNLKKQLLEMNILERPDDLLKQYKSLSSNTAYLRTQYINKLKEFSINSGMPTITADDEAENLASSLAVERKVAAVWTSDTDTYPLGAPLIVKGFKNINNEMNICGIITLKILQYLKLTHEEFRDFCILLGTDFNDRIPGIGPAKALILIRKYKNIENITAQTRHNTYCLKKDTVRQQLTPYDTNIGSDQLTIGINKIGEEYNKFIEKNHTVYSNYISNLRDMPLSSDLPKIKKE